MIRFAYIVEPPFNFRSPDGRPTGADVDLARLIAQRLGRPITFIETEFAELLPGLTVGRWDMTTGLFVTEQRQAIVSFTRPIWTLADGLLVLRDNPLALTGYASVSATAARLAVVRGQVQHDAAIAAGVAADRILIFENFGEAAAAVERGLVDAFASVSHAHRAHLAGKEGSDLANVEVPHSERPPALGAYAVSRGDSFLKAEIDAVLTKYVGTPDHLALLNEFGLSCQLHQTGVEDHSTATTFFR